MDNRKITKVANIVGIVSIILLVYWVFTFILITVFELKVFRENITESFYFSILGILALMFGSLIINVMFNMSSIAESLSKKVDSSKEITNNSSRIKALIIGMFVLITSILFLGDYLTSVNKEKILVNTATQLTETYSANLNYFVDYNFSKEYAEKAENFLRILTNSEKSFKHVSIITVDSIDEVSCFLEFDTYYYKSDSLSKNNFIFSSDKSKREYLNNVFDNKNLDVLFTSHDGSYELFYPYEKNNKIIVLYFNDYQRHGKIGS